MMRGLAVSVALAALGFVLPGSASAEGWYLMYPPIKAGEPLGPDLKAPLSDWEQYAVFDSGKACQNDQLLLWSEINARDEAGIDAAWDHYVVSREALFKRLSPDQFEVELKRAREVVRRQAIWWQEQSPLLRERLLGARCISVADPRLGRPR